MSPRAVSLAMILAIVGVGAAIGFLAGVRRKMNLEQWTVGGRGSGAALMFLLMAGEIRSLATALLSLFHSQEAPCQLRRQADSAGAAAGD